MSDLGLSDALDAELWEGGGTTSSVPNLYGLAINGHPFVHDLTQYKRRTLPLLRPPSDVGEEPGSQSRNTEGLWWRTGDDWSMGGGQYTYDRAASGQITYDRNLTSRTRFRASQGIDCWTDGQIGLLRDTTKRTAVAGGNGRLLAVGAYWYKVDGATLAFTSDLTVANPVWTAVVLTGVGASITGLATDGASVYASDGANIWKVVAGSAGPSAAWSTYDATGLWFGNGRLLASKANELSEVHADGTTVVVTTHFAASFTWVRILGAPNGIYAAGTAGNRSEIYYIGVTAAGLLDVPVIATPWPLGETINTMVAYAGELLIGTNKGFRAAQVTSRTDNHLSYGKQITIPGGVTAFAVEGVFAYFAWSNFDGTRTGLGRIAMDRYTDVDALVHSYASDLMATAQGTVAEISMVDTDPYFLVSTVGIYGPVANLVPSAVLQTGWLTFGDYQNKVAINLTVRHAALNGAIAVNLHGDDFDDNIGTSGLSGSTAPESITTPRRIFERAELVFTLTRGTDPTKGPILQRWTFRTMPAGPRVDEIIVALQFDQYVLPFIGEEQPMNTLAEFQYLKELETGESAVVLQEGNRVESVRLDQVSIDPSGFTEDHSFYVGVVFLRLLTMEG